MLGRYQGTITSQEAELGGRAIIFDVLQAGSVVCCEAGVLLTAMQYDPLALPVVGTIDKEDDRYTTDFSAQFGDRELSLRGTLRVEEGVGVGSGQVFAGSQSIGTWTAVGDRPW
jgi:hypothetical protein